MLVRDPPLAVNLAKAHSCAHPHVGPRPVRPVTADPRQAVAEGDVVPRGDAKAAQLVPDGSCERLEPRRQVLAIHGRPPVLERRREIGVLRALGTDNGQMVLLFVVEGLALGSAGWMVGMVLGWGMGRLFVAALSTVLFDILFRFPPSLLFGSLFFALALSLVASVSPALAAAHLRTIEAIRYE